MDSCTEKKYGYLPTPYGVAKKIQLDVECNGICSIIYEWTDEGWI